MGRGGVLGGLALVYKQLFTREDRFNAHKVLGFACLAHFIFRFRGAGAVGEFALAREGPLAPRGESDSCGSTRA